MAIARHLAEVCGVAGACPLAKAQAEEVAMAINGTFEGIVGFMFASESEKAAKKEKFCKETLPLKLGQLEARLCLRGGQFFAGNCLSWADIMLVALQDNLCSEVVGEAACLAKYPRLCSLYERVCCLPNIKAWRASRPVDPMFKN
jgi:glutathione S-transferase